MIRFEIITRDRLGITVELLEKIYKRNINLISMEVFFQRVCVKIEDIDEKIKGALKEELCEIEDVISINEMELLYHEQDERRLLAVIDSVDEGIISMDRNFNISIFNNYCEELFNYKKEEVIGRDIRKLIGEETPIVNLIKSGVEYDNLEFNLKNDRGEIDYISTGRTIKNDNDEVIGAVASIKDFNKARQLVDIISTVEHSAFKDIIGSSQSIEKVKKITGAVAKSNSTVLLRGESGTGKELFAKAIHYSSDRKNKSFVTINCAALPESLLESELFGYEKGSFTGAMQNGKDGLFKEASEGTLFLDEIGELSMVLQAKLLRVLQEGTIRKIGSNKEEFVDVRIIAATNKNLEDMISHGLFREDLYYRLNVIPICIPSLRERLEDIPSLVQFFIDKLNKRIKRDIKGAQLEFISDLMKYHWPGNVRELQNVVERAMNLCEGQFLTTKELIIDFKNENQGYVPNIIANMEKEQPSLKDELEQKEKEIISRVLKSNRSYRKTAKILKVSHTTIMNKIKKYNIKM
ncbi:sigma 54-interacting transcriptional regulator [Desnuesiella massiliensis]|uniref:sigma 54-interacting transcriptional regulator n=1 Tax=Desnuesiella massiliensis TaxID=1650662 RepID=UPI0006E3A8A7|nr:sigma 54-interacting transcriptional regulator [Desnuesiella massiliensis]